MNQPDKRLTKLLPRSISHVTMEQRDSPKNMQHASGTDSIEASIVQVVVENSHGKDLLSDLAQKISELLMADACAIVSAMVSGDRINDIGCWQKTDCSILSERIIRQLSILSLASHDDNTSSMPDSIRNLLEEILPTKTWMGITTKYQHQTNGLVLLLNQSEPWTNSQYELLTENSDLMAIAISQSQLKQQTQTKTRYQTLLKNISREIGRAYQPQLLYNKCLTELCTALQIDRGLILMLKYQNPLKAKKRKSQAVKGSVKIVGQSNVATNSGSIPSFSLDSSKLCQQAWSNAPNPLYFESDRAFPDLDCNAFQASGSALLMMPLMGKKNSKSDSAMTLGFLVLQHDSIYRWTEDELDLIDWVGVQISTAIVHHQTLNQVQSIVDEKTAQLKSSVNFQAKLSAKMRDHIQQLQQLNKLKDDFMNSMSHELKTPLTSMKMAIEMLRQTEISPQMRNKYLDILEQEWNREYSLIKDLLALQQLESGEITYSPQELDLGQTINLIAKSFVDKWQADREVDLQIEMAQADLKIYTDVESLEHILKELLSNAGKYCDPNTTIKLSVATQTRSSHRLSSSRLPSNGGLTAGPRMGGLRAEPQPAVTVGQDEIVISVANVGAGIAPEELPLIFDKFRRGKGVTDRAVPGTGLGLTLVQYFVEHLNGKIDATSEPLDDEATTFLTTFVLRLPQIRPVVS